LSHIYKNYNPDILETIANLSNDEVFTPPKLANKILDLLPQEIWKDSTITFLDPAVKTGIFLREIASRLIDGLTEEIPDLQERVNHILTKQVFGIGITELTTLMARRTLYCSMYANGEHSVCTEFDDEKGNIIFPDTKHEWNEKTGRCEYCGANKENYENEENKENHAYHFIHNFNVKETFENMKFDVIIGNPPYQLNVGNEGANSSKSKAIYHLFVDKAMELKPKYISMIIPSRWMNGNPDGISPQWSVNMINSNKLKVIHDFDNADDLFKDVGISGGANYFLWDKVHDGKCEYTYYKDNNKSTLLRNLNSFDSGIVIRDSNIISILEKIIKKESIYFKNNDKNFSNLVSPKDFFNNGDLFTSKWRGYSRNKDSLNNVKYYVSKSTNGVDYGWVKEKDVARNKKTLPFNKVYIPAAHGGQEQIIGKPIYGEPNSISSQTYLIVGYNHNLTKKECLNIMTYMKTKLFRFLVKIKKNTQNGARGVYQFVPLQDWSKPWTDEELYKKYKLTQEEIDYIEENIAPMD